MIRFFRDAVSDAVNDPFLPCSRLVAPFWVVWNWRALRELYRACPEWRESCVPSDDSVK
jgi:hypothetical protein